MKNCSLQAQLKHEETASEGTFVDLILALNQNFAIFSILYGNELSSNHFCGLCLKLVKQVTYIWSRVHEETWHITPGRTDRSNAKSSLLQLSLL